MEEQCTPMPLTELAALLQSMGCPKDKALEMAAQLDKRAGQLAARKGRSQAESLAHLLNLMKEGWAAKAKRP